MTVFRIPDPSLAAEAMAEKEIDSPISQPPYSGELPIHERREEILETIRRHPVTIISGETGSGKTTQLPRFLLECGLGRRGRIACTQPRRVAALSVARRIAEETGVPFGGPVGAKIRFNDQTSEETVIKLMTDGVLLNEIQEDPRLRGYEAVLIDEAHERSLNIDFLLGCLRNLTRKRPDLKILLSSATIDTEKFSKAFDNAPIIEVSGRMYPVETRYRPVDASLEDSGDGTYIEAAAQTVTDILAGPESGDILVFLPGERDIHELRRQLEDTAAARCDLLPLYGRLANADQQRIFAPGGRRRIILATNIAETSLTVPGIRHVVDTGLARISRYSPHSRTQRLPVEPIAQSSADQRKGRCGRVQNGICHRLYPEEDYLARPRHTTPEIHRANLAAVILRMLAFRLGDIRDFPFIDPPPDNAIRGGYRQLAELGAVRPDSSAQASATGDNADNYRLTPLGRRLAHLPIDPGIARMILQAREENALADVLVIAAGLSIQDPRERPAEQAKEADEAHRRFIHPESDFLTLLHIWNAFHEEMERLSQSQLRKFCKRHYLAYQRMREWRDIHDQLRRLLREKAETPGQKTDPGSAPHPNTDAGYRAIHRSILAGLPANVAVKESGHNYRGTRNRKALLFPGSGLYDKTAAKKQNKPPDKKNPPPTSAPDWIVCGEWMETSRLFARTAAKIEPGWIEDLAGDLLQTKHSQAFWSTKGAAARCRERKILFGLEIIRRDVSLTPIDPDEATDLFVRKGLIEEDIPERPDFLVHNARVREQAESEIARRRIGSPLDAEERLFAFYRRRLDAVGSFPELRRFAKANHGGQTDFLKAATEDLLPGPETDDTTAEFPTSVEIGGSVLPLHYRHQPGDEADGVTLPVPLAQIDALQPGTVDWAVPGHLGEKIGHLLRALPKSVRRQLHPIKERAAEIRQKLQPSERPLAEELARTLRHDYKIPTSPEDWARAELPGHLKPRIQVRAPDGTILATGRDLAAVRSQLEATTHRTTADGGLDAVPAWQNASARYERDPLDALDFGDLPEAIDLSGEAGLPLKAYPALVHENGHTALRLLPDLGKARQSTRSAWPLFAEELRPREFAWLRRDLRDLKQLGPLLHGLGDFDRLKEDAWQHLRAHLVRAGELLPLRASNLEAILRRADEERPGLLPAFIDHLRALLTARQDIALLLEKKKTPEAITYPGMRDQLERLVPGDFLRQTSYQEIPDITRFLKGMRIRSERAKQNLGRDMEKARRIRPWEERLQVLRRRAAAKARPDLLRPYEMLIEEFKVSIFAQELGTARKASEKRLQKLADEIEAALEAEPPPPTGNSKKG